MTTKKSWIQAAGSWWTLLALAGLAWAHEDNRTAPILTPESARASARLIQSQPGDNAWNVGRPAEDWWDEIKRQHGHVGPWNILGWRIGQAALREFKTAWGRHELEIICYIPPQTPFTCLVDGLSVGTGNSLGRLDLRLAEVMTRQQAFVAVRRKDGKGEVLEFRPKADYMQSIINQPVEVLETLSRVCVEKPEHELFAIRHLSP